MAGVTINGKDTNGDPISMTDVDLSYGLTISTIDKTLEWDLTTIDDEPHTEVTPYIGSRPDDR